MKYGIAPLVSLLSLLAAVVSEPATAQGTKNLILNGEVECAMEGQLVINATGDVLVEVQDLAECINEEAGLAISPLVLQPSTVAPGGSTSAVWASTGAESCEFELPQGWTVPSAGLSGLATINVPVAASTNTNYTITIVCQDLAGQPVQSDSQLLVEESVPDVPPDPPQLTRTVVDAVAPGEVRLNWSSSTGATDCEAESTPTVGAWSGSVGTGQNQQTLLTGLGAGSYNFALRCSNAAGDSEWEAVSANIATSTQCANRQPPAGWARMGDAGTNSCYYRAGVGWAGNDCTVWDGGISDSPFFEETGTTHRLAAAGRPDPEQYLAIEIDTFGMSPQETGRITSAVDGFADTPTLIVSISSCPGDFHPAQETGCYGRITTISPNFEWGGTSSGRNCQLESGATYYLNLAPTASSLGTDPDQFQTHPNCIGGACGKVFQLQ